MMHLCRCSIDAVGTAAASEGDGLLSVHANGQTRGDPSGKTIPGSVGVALGLPAIYGGKASPGFAPAALVSVGGDPACGCMA